MCSMVFAWFLHGLPYVFHMFRSKHALKVGSTPSTPPVASPWPSGQASVNVISGVGAMRFG